MVKGGERMNISILPNQFLKDNGTFDKEEAIKLCGKIAGVCYDKEVFNHLKDEVLEKTMKRVNNTLNNLDYYAKKYQMNKIFLKYLQL